MIDPGRTTPAVLDRMARDKPDHPALITEDRELSYAEYRHEARRAAATMIARGLQAGDRVAIWSPNTWHWAVAALGTHYAGGVLVPVNTNFTTTEATDILTRSKARLLLAGETLAGTDRITELDRDELPELAHIVRVPTGSADTTWPDLLDGPAVELSEVDARAAAVQPDDLADILFTSGTTGRSKGVMCAHRQSLSAEASASECRNIGPDDRILCMPPFFHSFGYRTGILSCLLSGSTAVVQRGFDIRQAMASIEQHRVTIFPGPPAFLQALLDHPARHDHDLRSLRLVATGGAPIPPALSERVVRELGATVLAGYGLTESSGYGAYCRATDGPMRAATTCGRAMAGFELRIHQPDDDGAGEILLRGPNVMLGYLDDPEATAKVIDPDGWLHTGDVGTLDTDGYLRVTDRLTDMYICGGVNVYPAEIEAVLTGFHGVTAAAVIGVPDDRLGEVGRAFVVPAPGTTIERAEIIAHARTQLAGYKIPRSVVIVDELPRNATGKVLKTALRDMNCTPNPPGTPAGLGGPPIGHVETWVADAWQILLNIEQPGRRDNFIDLGGDSLTAAEFEEMVHARFGMSISVDSLAERPTIAAIVAGLQGGADQQRQPVVRLREDREGPVCLAAPGIGGHAWQFSALARKLKGPCDIRALSLMDLRDGDRDQFRARIRDAATEAVRDAAGGDRPIVVIGYSFGALVAADTACRLLEQGIPVSRLILLDPDPVDSEAPGWDPRFGIRHATYLRFTPGSPAARKLEREIADVAELLQDAYLDGSVRLPPIPSSWMQTPKTQAKFAAVPTLFGTPASQIAKTMLDLDHLGMLRLPQVDELAGWVDGQLGAG